MLYFLKRFLALLGAFLALLNYFLTFDGRSFFPVGFNLLSLKALFTQVALPWLTRLGSIELDLPVSLLMLAYWGFLLLTFVQIGLGVWTLRSCSRRTRTWSIALALGGLLLVLLFFVGFLLLLAFLGLVEGRSPLANLWWMLQQALSPAMLRGGFVLMSRFLWLPTVGFALILVCNALTRPQERLSRLPETSTSGRYWSQWRRRGESRQGTSDKPT